MDHTILSPFLNALSSFVSQPPPPLPLGCVIFISLDISNKELSILGLGVIWGVTYPYLA